MSKHVLRTVALGSVVLLIGVSAYAVAGAESGNFRASLNGYEENPDISTVAHGSFVARLSSDGDSLTYELSYSGFETTVTASHVHFGKPAVNGGVSFFLCSGPTAPPCPQGSGTVTGEVDMSDVVGPAGQGIAAGEFDEILAAMRAGHAYVNVHSSTYPGGEIRGQIGPGHGSGD
jgi:hypothetical protein